MCLVKQIEATRVWGIILLLIRSVALAAKKQALCLGSPADPWAKPIRPKDGEQCAITAICTCFDKGLSALVPPVCQGACCNIGRGLWECRWSSRVTIQFHVQCNLGAFRLTKSITQSCGAWASHSYKSHCFCLLFSGWTKYRLAGKQEKWLLFSHTCPLQLYSAWSLKKSLEVRHELLLQSHNAGSKGPEELVSKTDNVSRPSKKRSYFTSSILLCPGARLCSERH